MYGFVEAAKRTDRSPRFLDGSDRTSREGSRSTPSEGPRLALSDERDRAVLEVVESERFLSKRFEFVPTARRYPPGRTKTTAALALPVEDERSPLRRSQIRPEVVSDRFRRPKTPTGAHKRAFALGLLRIGQSPSDMGSHQ